MANQINISNAGAYTETEGLSLFISNAGVYVEETNQTNQINVTVAGVYIENDGASIEISNVGVYVEETDPSFRFAVYYNNYNFCNVRTLKFSQVVSLANTTTLLDIAGKKIPILPSWQFDVQGFWCKELAVSLGNLGNQTQTILVVFLTDRYNNTFEFSNAESFITSFKTDINIDGVIIYDITIVGSGVLNYSEVI